ncbi:Calpain clp-1 [Portunus trituberculatus]|uniref:Calpain clp-1 n=1 Tax=Portunus trituberculatus TaxID=210409 RepID=A0A5B7GZP8_PORTR|nr:Calpain clp-1 [Portunus trituberculatus]
MGSVRTGIKIFVSSKKTVGPGDKSITTTTFRRVAPVPTTPTKTTPPTPAAAGTKRHRLSSVFSRQDSEEVFKFGERGSGLRPRGQVQDFYELRQQCMDSGTLFEDPDFPAEDSSIFFSRSPPKPFEWKRPHVSYIFSL